MQHSPFIVLGLPRSRTAWLAKFLSYGGFHCGHEELRHMRSLGDVRSWIAQPMTGTAETAAAPYWRLLSKLAPEARVVIVRRPVEAVVESLTKIETFGVGQFDRETLTRAMKRGEAKLKQVAARWPGALQVDFTALENEETCAAVFEHCLPYKHDSAWWRYLAPVNVQCDFPALMRYARAYAPQLAKLGETAAYQMRADLAAREQPEPDGMALQEESFDAWKRDGVRLFERHCVAVGEAPSAHGAKHWDLMGEIAARGDMQIVTARSNGRMFGYLMTILSPSLEDPGRRSAIQTTFFGDEAVPGIGTRLQRFALAKLKARGIDEVFFRAGPRGSGPKMGALYRRLGAEPDGGIYRLTFEGA